MTEYGVQTNNIFDLLTSADEAAKPAAAAKPKPRKKKSQRGPQGQAQPGAKPAPKKDQTGTPKPAQPRPTTTTVTVSGGRGSARGTQQQPPQATAPASASGRGSGRGGSPGQGNRQQRPALASGSEEFVRRHDDSHVSFADEKKSAGSARNEAAPAVKHNPPNRGREFDRHSGTGRSPVENKKGGGGHSNWGRDSGEDDLAALEDVKAEVAAESGEVKKDENKKRKKKKKNKKGEEEEETEKKDEIPDEQLKTLDDFLKEQATKAVKLSLPPARAAGEGVKVDPKWAEAVKREDKAETFLPTKEEPTPAKEGDAEGKKPSKSALRKKRKKEAKELAAKKLAEQNISSMFDFSAKKENEFGSSRGRGRGGPRDRGQGSQRGPREDRGPGSQRGPREDRGPRGPREDRGGQGSQRGRGGSGGPRNSPQPRKFKLAEDDAPQFDASAFPALQVGPPPITVD